MVIWQYLLALAGALVLVFAASVAPGRFFRVITQLSLNVACGMAFLIVFNAVAQPVLPINTFTLAVSGVLGLPGMVAVAAIAAV